MMGVPPPLRNWPLGLAGLFAGSEKKMQTNEERVKEVQDQVVDALENRGELYRQAAYQYLYGLGHRVPTGSPHDNLLRLAKKESLP